MEEWRDIKGYEGLYQVSNEGRVKSLERIAKRKTVGNYIVKEQIIKPQTISGGHLGFTPSKDGVQKLIPIHQAVAMAFIPNPNGYTLVHHKNHNPTDNRVENLEWLNRSTHQSIHNTENKKKLTYQYTLDNTLVKEWKSVKEAAKELGIGIAGISNCAVGRLKTYKGYKWSHIPL